MSLPAHIPVLLDHVLDALSPQHGQTYADATAGLGGHALEVARHLGPTGHVVLNDVDPGNLTHAGGTLRGALGPACPRLTTILGNFADLPRRMIELGLRADAVLADLGFSSNQMDNAARGLSFQSDAPLDMRLDPTLPTSAADLVATLPEDELARILSDYGEERHAHRIARRLVDARAAGPISTTFQLADLVRSAQPRHKGTGDGIDPATRTFQALRIAVNDELGVLESLLASIRRGAGVLQAAPPGTTWLAPRARVAIISFHSLEDRPVKRVFGDLVREGLAEDIGPRLRRADEGELRSNRRARSARLRAIRLR